MCRISNAAEDILWNTYTMVARRFDNRTRSAVIDYHDSPHPTPYDLFLTLNHVIALGQEENIPPDVINECVETINDLFYASEDRLCVCVLMKKHYSFSV